MAPSATTTSSSISTDPAGLTSDQLEFWDTNGYLILENALDKSTVSSLLGETKQMLNDFSLDDHPMTRFSTGEGDSKHVGDDYFLTSGDKVRFFFEEDAFDASTGTLTKPKHRAINKIGHNLHGLSPAFRAATVSPQNRSIARSLGLRDPQVLQSMIICKQPEIGGRVPPHQDSTFLYTNPPSAVGFWYALEDATVTNGCLSFAKGSHKRTPIGKRFVRQRDGSGTEFEDVRTAQYPKELDPCLTKANGHINGDANGTSPSKQEQYTLGEVKAGSLVLIHGNLLHKSEKNTSDKGRIIYTFHMIEGGEGWDYDERNWLQPKVRGEGFERLYDAV